jgi:putative SOS response-associated peptidase YedK
MPVILAPESVDAWLEGPWSEERQKLLQPCPDEWLTACPVSKAVGNVRNKGAEMLTPAGSALF